MDACVAGVRLCRDWQSRLRGLLRTGHDAAPVMLLGCRSVHTWGMRYPIDLAFVDRAGKVLKAMRGVPPGRVAWCVGAADVVERPCSKDWWPEVGDVLSLCLVAEGGNDE